MSKHTVTMKHLMDENTLLKIRMHELENGVLRMMHAEKEASQLRHELAGYKARGFWPKLVELVRGAK